MTSEFSPQNYGPLFGPLLAAAPLNELGPGWPMAAMEKELEGLSVEAGFAPHKIVDRSMAEACLSGLWLRFDFLDESHSISQEIHNTTGSFWHGIMHRREPDYDNAKYWFRRVPQHPVFGELLEAARQTVKMRVGPQKLDPTADKFLQRETWDPFQFVDLVASVIDEHSSIQKLCRDIQLREWELLFDFCFRQATSRDE